MRHSSTRAAQVYPHARRGRDREIASTLGKLAERELKKIKKPEKQRKPKGSGGLVVEGADGLDGGRQTAG